MKSKRRLLAAGIALLAAMPAAPARAQLTLTLTPDIQSSAANGAVLLFTGLLTNGAARSSITSFTFSAPALAANPAEALPLPDATPFDTFLLAAPDPFPSGYSNPGTPLFTITVPAGAAVGAYTGTLAIDYDIVDAAGGVIGSDSVSNDFGVTVLPARTEIPEPGTLLLLMGGVVGRTLARRRGVPPVS